MRVTPTRSKKCGRSSKNRFVRMKEIVTANDNNIGIWKLNVWNYSHLP